MLKIYSVTVRHAKSGMSWYVRGVAETAEVAIASAKSAIATRMEIPLESLSADYASSWDCCEFCVMSEPALESVKAGTYAYKTEAVAKKIV